NDDGLIKRRDGKYEERLSDIWIAEYSENPDTGLWQVEVFKSDVAEWFSLDHVSLDDARQAAYNFYDQA
ncbi:MAG: hypothetical protein HKM94_08935, partial [Halobacteria archaeon]|nr:hypothetical protein [Halobacteria archaeon]